MLYYFDSSAASALFDPVCLQRLFEGASPHIASSSEVARLDSLVSDIQDFLGPDQQELPNEWFKDSIWGLSATLVVFSQLRVAPARNWHEMLGRIGHRHYCRNTLVPITWEEIKSVNFGDETVTPLNASPKSTERHYATAFNQTRPAKTSAAEDFRWTWYRHRNNQSSRLELIGRNSLWELRFFGINTDSTSVEIRLTYSEKTWVFQGELQERSGSLRVELGEREELQGLVRDWVQGALKLQTTFSESANTREETYEIASPFFDETFFASWCRDEVHGFWACLQRLYCNSGQLIHSLGWMLDTLGRFRKDRVGGTRHLESLAAFCDAVVLRAWKSEPAQAWRDKCHSPLQSALAGDTDRLKETAFGDSLLQALSSFDDPQRQLLLEWLEQQNSLFETEPERLRELLITLQQLIVGFYVNEGSLKQIVPLLFPAVSRPKKEKKR